MKNKTTSTLLVSIFFVIFWTILSKYIGFESVVIVALACIYGRQK